MIGNLFRRRIDPSPLLSSRLYNEQTFYTSFLHDLRGSRKEVLIESPFITERRMKSIYPVLRKLVKRGVQVSINTRDPYQHEPRMKYEAEAAVSALQALGVQVLYTDNHHRKLAIIDNLILWEGSLNILSQAVSSEVMRRLESEALANEMVDFIKLERFL